MADYTFEKIVEMNEKLDSLKKDVDNLKQNPVQRFLKNLKELSSENEEADFLYHLLKSRQPS